MNFTLQIGKNVTLITFLRKKGEWIIQCQDACGTFEISFSCKH